MSVPHWVFERAYAVACFGWLGATDEQPRADYLRESDVRVALMRDGLAEQEASRCMYCDAPAPRDFAICVACDEVLSDIPWSASKRTEWSAADIAAMDDDTDRECIAGWDGEAREWWTDERGVTRAGPPPFMRGEP